MDRLERAYGLPSGVLNAMWLAESDGGRAMVSPKNAKGPFQFIDATAKRFRLRDPYDFGQAARAAAAYLRENLDRFDGDLDKALAAYNWGEGHVQDKGMARLPGETRDYISKIRSTMGAK